MTRPRANTRRKRTSRRLGTPSGATAPVPPAPESRDYLAIARAYADDILAGRVRACEWVRLAVERQRRDLARQADPAWPFLFDPWYAGDVCDFLEKLPHVEGKWPTPTIRLEAWQVFVLTTIFGWRRREDPTIRRFNTVYIELARKNAKSTISSGVALYCLTCENEPGAQVKCAATTGSQARIVFSVAKQIVEATPELAQAFDLEPLANAIACGLNGGSIKPINAKASTQDGLNPHCSIIDELHAHANRSLFDVLKSARGARRNPLSWYITTAGYNMLGVCYEQRTLVSKMLLGIEGFEAEHYFGIIYTLDDVDDPFDETVWIKANPNLGVSVNLEEFRTYAAEARVSPDSEGEYKTKRLNLWMNAAGAWLNMAAWDRCADLAIRLEDFLGDPCWIGGDLAQSDDLAALGAVFRRNGLVFAFVRFYLPRLVVEARARKVPAYLQWRDKGILTLTEGNMIDYGRIERDVRELAQRFDVRAIRFDHFGSTQITGNLFNDGLPAEILRKNADTFTDPARFLETHVNAGTFRHDGNPCLKWNASNCVARRGAVDDFLVPKKSHPDSPNKIDGIDAILEALHPMLNEPETTSAYADHELMTV